MTTLRVTCAVCLEDYFVVPERQWQSKCACERRRGHGEEKQCELANAVAERVIEEIVRRLRIISATSEGTWPFVGEYTTTTFYDTESDQRSGLVEALP